MDFLYGIVCRLTNKMIVIVIGFCELLLLQANFLIDYCNLTWFDALTLMKDHLFDVLRFIFSFD